MEPKIKDYKQLAETIFKRKAVRAYSERPCELLDGDADLVEAFGVQPLVDGIKVKVKVLKEREVKNKRSDYCIAFYSEDKSLHLDNIGFIGQQIELELQSRGLGTCWWGMKKPKKDFKAVDGLDCVITMTAGYPKSDETRAYPDGFKRKVAKDIILGGAEPDALIETVRIAPSAMNLQPWLIEKNGSRYDFYLRPPKGFMEKMMGHMRRIDMGIAMAQLFVQAKANGSDVSFGFDGNDKAEGKYIASLIAE
ncbi:MAG: hypothetical protein FWD58_01950 [Firmicutes bacterium]|nr:hypothetical protein [Bacillota bacterium]